MMPKSLMSPNAKPIKMLLVSALFFSICSYSKATTIQSTKAPTAQSTKEMAEAEISQSLKGVKMTSPTEVQLSGVIQMQTTDLEKQARDFKYVLSFNYLKVGMNSSNSQMPDYSFQEKEFTKNLPVIGFGFLNNSDEAQYGFLTELGFLSENLQANFKSGLVEKDIRLNSTWLALLGLIQKNFNKVNHTLKIGLATQLNSQGSSNSYLSDFESPTSTVAAYELSYNLTSSFSLTAEARLINQMTSSKWKLDSNSYGIGATAKW